jgi:hypothetical protein
MQSTAEVTLYTDPMLLRTILFNLVDNAFRFSKRKENSYVSVSLQKLAGNEVCIQVRDNGIGIQPEIRNKLFTMFFRGTVNTSGTGLGLYIARIAAERLCGTVSLQPYRPEETIFEVFLPAHLPISVPFETMVDVQENVGLT